MPTEKSDSSTLSFTTVSSTKDMDRIQFTALLPSWLCQYCDTVPKVINNLLLVMGGCNFFLMMSVLGATMLPNLGVSPTFIAFLLLSQNCLTWFALNNHRMSSLPSLVANEFVIGCLLGIAVGGSLLSFVLSSFFGKLSNCVKIEMQNYDYECKHQGTMKSIWFWSGIVCWLNTCLAILIVYGRDELSFLQHQSYENIGLALEELQNNFERNAVYTHSSGGGDGTFFGSRAEAKHETLGDAQFPTTPSQEESSISRSRNNDFGGYGADSGFSDSRPDAETDKEAQILSV